MLLVLFLYALFILAVFLLFLLFLLRRLRFLLLGILLPPAAATLAALVSAETISNSVLSKLKPQLRFCKTVRTAKKPILEYFDRPFTEEEQKLATTAIAKACVKTSTPFNALEHEAWKEVFAVLRKDFVPPTRYFLQSSISLRRNEAED